MDQLRDQEAYDAATIVHRFLNASSAEGIPPHEESLVTRLCGETIVVFQGITKHLQRHSATGEEGNNDVREAVISLQRSYNRLKLWSDGYGICTGQLDDTFAKSQKLRGATLKILASIGEALCTRLGSLPHVKSGTISKAHDDSIQRLKILMEAAQDDQGDNGSSSDSSSEYESDSIQEAAEDLKVDTMCLMELDPLFQNPVLDIEREKSVAATESQEWLPQNAYSDRIATRFPKACAPLVSRLGQASLERYLRCQSEREKQEKGDDEGRMNQLAGMFQSDGSSSKFRDSALGSSIPSSASNADTIMSYHGDRDRSVVRIPPLPRGARDGKPFNCVACSKSLVLRTNSAWKRHLYQDLVPWQCLDVECPFAAVFFNRQDWVAHLADEHDFGPGWKATDCPLCLDRIGPGKIPIVKHLGSHLEEISLGALPSNIDLNVESDIDDEEPDDESGSEDPVNDSSVSTHQPVLPTAMNYLDMLKVKTRHEPHIYDRFLCIMKDFQEDIITTSEVTSQVTDLLSPYPDMIRDFNAFLPPEYYIDSNLKVHHNRVAPPPLPPPRLSTAKLEWKPQTSARELDENPKEARNEEYFDQQVSISQSAAPPRDERGGVEFNYAINYVNRVKARFKDEPQVYEEFLKILQIYQAEELSMSQVHERVGELLQTAPDLREDFRHFAPLESQSQPQ